MGTYCQGQRFPLFINCACAKEVVSGNVNEQMPSEIKLQVFVPALQKTAVFRNLPSSDRIHIRIEEFVTTHTEPLPANAFGARFCNSLPVATQGAPEQFPAVEEALLLASLTFDKVNCLSATRNVNRRSRSQWQSRVGQNKVICH